MDFAYKADIINLARIIRKPLVIIVGLLIISCHWVIRDVIFGEIKW